MNSVVKGKFYFYLRGTERRERGRRGQREHSCLLFHCNGWGSAKAGGRSSDQSGLPDGWQESNYLSYYCYFLGSVLAGAVAMNQTQALSVLTSRLKCLLPFKKKIFLC